MRGLRITEGQKGEERARVGSNKVILKAKSARTIKFVIKSNVAEL
jgi:hypothetical protein